MARSDRDEALEKSEEKYRTLFTLAALTGWGQADDRRLTAEAGFKHHLTKPIDLGELRHILQEAPRAE